MDEAATGPVRPQARCTICNGTSDDTVLRENGYEGRACACGTIYMTPEPSAEDIDRTVDGHPEAFFAWPAALKARWLRRHTSGRRLLEIGCGTGSFLEAAHGVGFQVEGIEAETTRAASAARRLNSEVRAGFFEDLEAEPRFDVVYHCDMLPHFERPAAALQLMVRFLRPGGVLAFEVGLTAELSRFWYSWIGEIGYPQHRWLYSRRSLRRLLHETGLRIEHIKIFDLSAWVAANHGLRAAARVVRKLTRRRRMALRDSGRGDPGRGGQALLRFEKFLVYRVGAWLPRLGPATALVIARPMEDIRNESLRVVGRRRRD